MYGRMMRRCIAHVTSRVKSQSVLRHPGKIVRITCCYYSNQQDLFHGEKDRFGGITVDTSQEKWSAVTFSTILDKSIIHWRSKGNRCIWFKVNIKNSTLVPLLAEKGFNFHHAREEFLMMYKWLPTDSEPNLPPLSHTNLGVGCLVFNGVNQLLAVSEQHYEYPHWKLPGGYVERGEDITAAAAREVKEETGVDAVFQSMVTFRHTHNMMYGNSDIYVILMMKALTEKITISQREVRRCQWMDVKEYTNHEHVHAFNRLIVHKALEYKANNMKLDIKKKTVKWSTMTREMNYLVVEDFDYNASS